MHCYNLSRYSNTLKTLFKVCAMRHNHDESCFSISGWCNRNDSSPVLEKGSRPFSSLILINISSSCPNQYSSSSCTNHNFFCRLSEFPPITLHHSAQFAGLLCEEQGSDADNVKYCGYCKYHHSKLVSVLSDFCHFPEITCLLCLF